MKSGVGFVLATTFMFLTQMRDVGGWGRGQPDLVERYGSEGSSAISRFTQTPNTTTDLRGVLIEGDYPFSPNLPLKTTPDWAL